MDRSAFSAHDIVQDIWTSLRLPPEALRALDLDLPGHAGPAIPSSFKIGLLAQSSIALSALTAALLHAARRSPDSEDHELRVPRVSVPLDHAVAEFRSEQLYTIDDRPPDSAFGVLGGLHRTKDGYVRIHDTFPNHAQGTLKLLGLPPNATREDVAARTAGWRALDLEEEGTHRGKLAIYALRSYAEWDALPQAGAVGDDPILLRHVDPNPSGSSITASPSSPPPPRHSSRRVPVAEGGRCLKGIRVLEMSRVIAAPVAGKALAAHGADILWVTSPHLPAIPPLDRDLSRGKRSIQLDLRDASDKAQLLSLLRDCDVFLQGYRPGSLAAHGLSPESLAVINPGIVCANMSAFGPAGPWAGRRGFDSLVQTCTGMNVSEAEHAGLGEPARGMPCQALDHASGYFLAAGVAAALWHREREREPGGRGSGAYVVDVSLAGTMKYLRSLGQYSCGSGGNEVEVQEVPAGWVEERQTGFGRMRGVRHSADVEGCEVGWERGPSVLGEDEPAWLEPAR